MANNIVEGATAFAASEDGGETVPPPDDDHSDGGGGNNGGGSDGGGQGGGGGGNPGGGGGFLLTTDQRGEPRIQGRHVDIGAFEDVVAADWVDLAVFPTDITFHDPVSGVEIFPGDAAPILPGTLIEVRVGIRNLGNQASPAGVAVRFDYRQVPIVPPAIGAPVQIGSANLPSIAAGSLTTVSFQAAFLSVGFYTLT
jgi:hypothetical protein